MNRKWRHRRRRLYNWLAGAFGPCILRAYVGSLRLRWSGSGLVRPSPAGRENVTYFFWHQRLLPFSATHRGLGIRCLISSHGDGELLARVAEGLGSKAIRGSSTRGGVKAMRELLSEVGTGHDFVITPDGPQGPCHVFQQGGAYFASRSGLLAIPATVSYLRYIQLKSWDRFVIPLPFTRGVVLTGTPIRVPPDLDGEELERWREKLEGAVRTVTDEAERRFEELYRGGISTRDLKRITPPIPSTLDLKLSPGSLESPPTSSCRKPVE